MGRKAFSGKGGIDEIGKKIGNLGLLRAMGAYNWALKPCGSVFPYFCIVTIHDKGYVRARISFLEGWQTMHDYVRMRFEPDSGYYVSQTELPQFEVAYLRTGKIVATRHDPGCLPWYLTPRQEGLVRRMLWETYGVMLRIENDRSLVLKHADERALFARVETSPGVWRDAPMTIPEPPPYEERVPVPQDLLKRAQSLPVDKDWKVAVDLRYRQVDRRRAAARLLRHPGRGSGRKDAPDRRRRFRRHAERRAQDHLARRARADIGASCRAGAAPGGDTCRFGAFVPFSAPAVPGIAGQAFETEVHPGPGRTFQGVGISSLRLEKQWKTATKRDR